MGGKKFPIVYITDDNYVDYTLTSIKSLLLYAREEVAIYVVCNNVSSCNKGRLQVDGCIRLIDFTPKTTLSWYRYVSPSAFIKFDLPNIIEEDVCLFVDGDTIFSGDICEIFSYNVSSHYAAVMKDFGRTYIWPSSISRNMFYAGTMLLNLKKWREDGICDRLYRKKIEHIDEAEWNEMEVLNNVFSEDDVIFIPIKYCVSLEKIKYGKRNEYRDIQLYNSLYGTNYRSVKELIEDAVIFHLHGEKPKVYANQTIYALVDDIESRFVHRGIGRIFIFSNVCRFESAEDVQARMAELDIKEDDTLIFLNTAQLLTRFYEALPKARIVTIHRFKRDASGWWGLKEVLSFKSEKHIDFQTLLMDNKGNISTLHGKLITKVELVDYPKDSVPTTGFLAFNFAKRIGREHVFLVNFYGTKDNSTPHFRPHEWGYEERALMGENHIYLEPTGCAIPEVKQKKGPSMRVPQPKIYYGRYPQVASKPGKSGWNW